jgi:hypothetical protein
MRFDLVIAGALVSKVGPKAAILTHIMKACARPAPLKGAGQRQAIRSHDQPADHATGGKHSRCSRDGLDDQRATFVHVFS